MVAPPSLQLGHTVNIRHVDISPLLSQSPSWVERGGGVEGAGWTAAPPLSSRNTEKRQAPVLRRSGSKRVWQNDRKNSQTVWLHLGSARLLHIWWPAAIWCRPVGPAHPTSVSTEWLTQHVTLTGNLKTEQTEIRQMMHFDCRVTAGL